MPWFAFVLGAGAEHRTLYVEAGDEEHALDKARAHGYQVSKVYWGPFSTLWEVSAKNRFCEFGNGIWFDRPPKDKKYRRLYTKLTDHILKPDVTVLGSLDEERKGEVEGAERTAS